MLLMGVSLYQYVVTTYYLIMKILLTFFTLTSLFFVVFQNKGFASDGWYFHSNWGLSNSMNSTLSIKRDNSPHIVHNAKWKAKSFSDSWYYTVKLEKWLGDKARGIEWVHHKIYLANPPAGLDEFSISDGYNMLFYNFARKTKRNRISRLGLGLVFGHPDVTFTGAERFYMKGGAGGSYLAGVAAQVSLEKWLYETDHFIFSVEGKLTASYARVPVSENRSEFAEAPVVAWHLTFGLGSKPLKKQASLIDWTRYIGVPLAHHLSMYILE